MGRQQTKSNKDDKRFKAMNNKQYNKRNSSKNQRRDKEIADTATEMLSKSNPYTWYANFPQYAEDVANLAFGLPVGQIINLNGINGVKDAVSAAGLMTIWFTPTIGVSKDLTSPINRQAVRLYTYLRSIQRAAASYDAADLMMYLIGVDSLYTYWSYLRRAYGVAQLFTPTNKYYPRRLLQAMGIDPSICENLADFRAYINRFALHIGKFAMPKHFNLTERHRWMCEGLYLDSNTKKAQTYMFVPALVWQYDNTVSTGSQLTGVQIASFSANPVFRDVHSLVALGEQLLNSFENDEDTMNISGDIYRAYEGNLYTVEETPDNYSVLPVYDETVASQIENSVAVGRWVKSAADVTVAMPTITQNPEVNNGAILFNGYVDAGGTQYGTGEVTGCIFNYRAVASDLAINLHWDKPTSQQVMEATRLSTKLVAAAGGITNAHVGLEIDTSAADIVNYYTIVITNPANPAAIRFLNSMTNSIFIGADGTPINPNATELLALLQQFDWGPIFDVVTYSGAGTIVNQDLTQLAFDVDNLTYASRQQLNFINEAALLSLLDMPTPASK